MNKSPSWSWWLAGFWALIACGVVMRLWSITANQFLFYDEGMYLGYNRHFLNLVAANFPKDINELFIILGLMFKTALSTAKALWFFVLNLRVFILGPEAWYFARLVSAIAGIATIALTYLFAYRYFQSTRIAALSALFLSFLPSHMFYSRLGMQESFSTLLFLAALYVYFFYKHARLAPVLSAILLACVFLTNYRMIIAPLFIITIEIFEAYKNRGAIDWKKALICIGTFAVIIFVVGSLYGGINRYVTFGWMFHQAQEAQGQRSWINFFSYPYYTFALEGILVGLIFWSNIYLVIKKQWPKLLPFTLVLLQMGIFSLAAEKGARYLCVVLPFMAIAAAIMTEFLFPNKKRYYALIFSIMLIRSLTIVNVQTDYEKAVGVILKNDANAKIISTQPLVEALYVKDEESIKECPKNLPDFIALYAKGYRYLILDPQAYISWTKDTQRFNPELIDFLETIHRDGQPLFILKHLQPAVLKRFVLDHNQNLSQSLKFLNLAPKAGYGEIRVYDVGQVLMLLKQQAMQKM